MAFKINKSRQRQNRKAGVSPEDSIDRIRLSFGLTPRDAPVILVKKSDKTGNDEERAATSE